MCQCHSRVSCHACSQAIDRRRFLQQGGAALAAAGCLSPAGRLAFAQEGKKVRVAAVFLAQVRKSKVLVLGRGRGGQQENVLGASWQYVDWKELE